ncbi:hypothetical protein DOM22_12060 [Bdellovibrio sp. ZAP7]|nr:hypothetical protein DOM22_12060 [Bdellovibrio sp. ZAP7]
MSSILFFSLARAKEPVSIKRVQWEDKFDPKNPPKYPKQCDRAKDCQLIVYHCSKILSVPIHRKITETDIVFCEPPYNSRGNVLERLIKTYEVVCAKGQCDKKRKRFSLQGLDYYSCDSDKECTLFVDRCRHIQAINTDFPSEFEELQNEELSSCALGDDTADKFVSKCNKNKCQAERKLAP